MSKCETGTDGTNMVQCAAFGCQNKSSSRGKDNKPTDVSFHRFPLENSDLLKIWLHNLGREGFVPTKHSKLCSAHFLPECYKEDVYTKYGIGVAGRIQRPRKVKDDAVPTEFVHRRKPQPVRQSSIARSTRLQHQATVAKLLSGELSTSESSVSDAVQKQTKSLPSKAKKRRVATATVTRAMAESEETTEEQTLEMPEILIPLHPENVQSSVQEAVHVYGTPRRTARDHAYATRPTRTVATQTETVTHNVEEREQPMELSSPLTSPLKSETGFQISDVEYMPSSDSGATDSSSSSDGKTSVNPCDMKKFIVFADNLKELNKFCKECGSPVVNSSQFTSGSMVGFRNTCHTGHTYVWQSQPIMHKLPLGNLLLSCAILTSGNTYAKINAFAEQLNLQLISKNVYNRIQKKHVLPVVQDVWEREKRRAVEEVRSHGSVTLAGDGRSDSPGHSAKYGSYTLMHADGEGKRRTRKIVSMHLVQVSEVKNSNQMEPEGLRRCLNEVKGEVDVKVLATGRHPTVSSSMKKDYKEINHQFDTWHLVKSVVKKLTAVAKKKNCSQLFPWIQSISNHLWWACATCGENKLDLKERWMSVLHHVSDRHKWSGNTKFHRCEHKKLSAEDRRTTKWLKPGSAAFIALQKIVTETRLLKSLENLTKFCHTGDVEVFHNMLLKYCPKRQHFHYDAMTGRLMLAAFDWNRSDRQRQMDKSGKPAVSVVFSKRRKAYILKNKYQKIASKHMRIFMTEAYIAHRDQMKHRPIIRPNLPARIGAEPKPSKELLVEQFKSRFK